MSPWVRQEQSVDHKRTPAPNTNNSDSGDSYIIDMKCAPCCAAGGFECEVQELISNLRPAPNDERVVRRLVRSVERVVLPVIPEAEVKGIAAANLQRSGATGMKPEIEIVVLASPEVLIKRLQEYYLRVQPKSGRHRKSPLTLHPDVLQKSAIRTLSERLTAWKFWRSAFRGPEPKLVLLAPASLGIFPEDIRVSFSVNTPYPLNFASIMSRLDVRARNLVLFVRRWSHDRCVSNVAKGHLHPYAWSLLVTRFLRCFHPTLPSDVMSTANLFKEFVNFYNEKLKDFDPTGARLCIPWAAPADGRPSGSVAADFGESGFFIEDPFDAAQNVGSTLTKEGLLHLQEELARACALLDADERPSKLRELLERWVPAADGAEQFVPRELEQGVPKELETDAVA